MAAEAGAAARAGGGLLAAAAAAAAEAEACWALSPVCEIFPGCSFIFSFILAIGFMSLTSPLAGSFLSTTLTMPTSMSPCPSSGLVRVVALKNASAVVSVMAGAAAVVVVLVLEEEAGEKEGEAATVGRGGAGFAVHHWRPPASFMFMLANASV